MVKLYRKKPVVIKALEWNGNNLSEVEEFHGCKLSVEDSELIIPTLEDGKTGQAKHVASQGDYIIQGVQGEFYACKPDIFAATYEEVE